MFTVGEFSKICQVSVKTLHYYDRIALLQPARVDKFTGYRYYSREQLSRMLLIQRLKRYGFTLEEIACFLACSEPEMRQSILRRQKQKLAEQMQKMRLIIKELDNHLQSYERTGDIMNYQNNYRIEIVETGPQAVLASRQHMSVADFGQYYSKFFEKIASRHLTPNGICGALYYDHEFNPEHSDIEVFVGILENEQAEKILPGQLCAKTLHKGPYGNLHDAYGAIINWIAANGYICCDAPFDIYSKGFSSNLPPEQWETEVYFPVQKQ